MNKQTLGIRIDSDAQIKSDAGSKELVPLEIRNLQDYVSAFYILALENLNRSQLQSADWERTISVSSAGITPRVKRLSRVSDGLEGTCGLQDGYTRPASAHAALQLGEGGAGFGAGEAAAITGAVEEALDCWGDDEYAAGMVWGDDE